MVMTFSTLFLTNFYDGSRIRSMPLHAYYRDGTDVWPTVVPKVKKPPKMRFKKFVKLTGYTYARNSLTNWCARNDRERKSSEFTKTCLEKFVKSHHVNLFLAGFSYLEPTCVLAPYRESPFVSYKGPAGFCIKKPAKGPKPALNINCYTLHSERENYYYVKKCEFY